MIKIHSDDFPAIAYTKTGLGPVVVLLHGFPENGGLWHNIVPALSVSYTVIVPDIPGAGNSVPLVSDTTSMEQLAHSIKAIIDNEHLDKVVLAGHSMGGYIALAFADAYPEYVKGLCLIHSTAAADTEEKKENRYKAIALIKKGGKESFLRNAIPNMFADRFKNEHPEIIEEQIKRGMQLADNSMIAYYDAMAKRPGRQEVLKSTAFPVQWIFGKEDNLIDFSNTLAQSRLNNISFVAVYEGCGHMSMLEATDKLKFNIEEFASYCYNS